MNWAVRTINHSVSGQKRGLAAVKHSKEFNVFFPGRNTVWPGKVVLTRSTSLILRGAIVLFSVVGKLWEVLPQNNMTKFML